ncbi:MAG: MFS transporter [Rhabdochlamydiaceae bacterium]
MKNINKGSWFFFLANIFDHYDTSLFGFLIPFLAPLFFPFGEDLKSLIFMYLFIPLGFFSRFLGSFFLGKLADSLGCFYMLRISLIGLGAATVLMGFIPIYEKIGFWSPLLMLMLRLIQTFFASLQSILGSIYILKDSKEKQRGLRLSFYDILGITGALFASFLVNLLGQDDLIKAYWRYLFWIGGSLCFFAYFFKTSVKSYMSSQENESRTYTIPDMVKEFPVLLQIFLCSGFSYACYYISFHFMNVYIPQVTNHTLSSMMDMNSWLLFCDIIFLLLAGLVTKYFDAQKMMKTVLICSFSLLPILNSFVVNSSFVYVFSYRLFIVGLGVFFTVPYCLWRLKHLPSSYKYTAVGIATVLGSQLLGSSSSFFCLFLFKLSIKKIGPLFYLSILGFTNYIFLIRLNRNSSPFS